MKLKIDSADRSQFLSPLDRLFLVKILEEGASRSDIPLYIKYLLSPKRIIPDLEVGIKDLEQYKVLPNNAKNPDIQQGYKVLSRFIEQKAQVLQEKNAVVQLWGSMAYDDAKKLDFDLEVCTLREDKELRSMVFQWQNELQGKWINQSQGDMYYLSFQKINDYIRRLQENDLQYIGAMTNAHEMRYTIAELAIILFGYPLYTPNDKLLQQMQSEALRLATIHPIVGTCMMQETQDSLNTRRIRRNLISDPLHRKF